jgi:hypothetical protein
MTFLHLSLLIISLQDPWPAEEAGMGARDPRFRGNGHVGRTMRLRPAAVSPSRRRDPASGPGARKNQGGRNMLIALLFWGASIVFCIAVALYLCHRIEVSGVRRWGATGKLLRYE